MKKILYQPWGGLGDNLQYSTLPERLSEAGHDVYISDKNVYRHPEIYDLVWKINPYVKGIISENANCGSCCYKIFDNDKSVIYNQEASHGVIPKNEIPKIFYKPKYINELKNTVIVNLSSFATNPFAPNNFSNFLRETFKDKKILIVKFNNKTDYVKQKIDFSNDGFIEINSIFSYCDIIHSCFYFICSYSGQSVLSSALNKTDTLCFQTKDWISGYNFPNIKYQVIENGKVIKNLIGQKEINENI